MRPIDTPIESLVNLPSCSEVSITDGFHKCFKTPKMHVMTRTSMDCEDLMQTATSFYPNASIQSSLDEWPGDTPFVC